MTGAWPVDRVLIVDKKPSEALYLVRAQPTASGSAGCRGRLRPMTCFTRARSSSPKPLRPDLEERLSR